MNRGNWVAKDVRTTKYKVRIVSVKKIYNRKSKFKKDYTNDL